MSISAAERDVLHLMRDDLLAHAPNFAPHGLWADIELFFERKFETEDTTNIEDKHYNFYYGGTSPSTNHLYAMFTTLLYNHIKERDFLQLLQRNHSRLTSAARSDEGRDLSHSVIIDGRPISHDLLFSVYDVYKLLELHPGLLSEPTVILDLGAGWGRIGDMILTINDRATYVVVDIPTSLIISGGYLPRLHPRLKAASYHEARNLPALDRDALSRAAMWFLTPAQLLNMTAGSVDLAVNVASFMEMSHDVVSGYIKQFDRVAQFGHVYLRNQIFGVGSDFHQYAIPRHWRQKYFTPSIVDHGFYETAYSVDAPPFSLS